MAELISAKDLPITEAEEVDVLCVDNGELKRKQAKGLGGGAGGYVIRVPLTDFGEDENGNLVVNLTEDYDNFAQILYDGGNVVFDVSEAAKMMNDSFPSGTVMYVPAAYWGFVPGMGIAGTVNVMGMEASFLAGNGTWTPPTE